MRSATSMLWTAVRHASVLLRAVLKRSGRARVGESVRLLREASSCLRSGGLPALAELLDHQPASAARGNAELTLEEAEAVAALWLQPGMRRCLRRAVLRYVAVRAAGGVPSLVIGAARVSKTKGLAGHAWVEVEGSPYREGSDAWRGMTEMYRHPLVGGLEDARRKGENLATSE